MSFGFEFDMGAKQRESQLTIDRETARNRSNEKADLEQQQLRSAAKNEEANSSVQSANIELARRKAQQKLDNFNSGVVSSRDKEAEMSDFERKKQSGDYDLGNQIKAWGSANQYRMAEADQSNVAQKDRLGMQLGTQEKMQQAQIGQENRLRSDDNQRAIDGFKMKF